MRVLDPGHLYLLDSVDSGAPQYLAFVKREGEGYPFNVGHHGGTQSQEVLRMLINRAQYTDNQIAHPANALVIRYSRLALFALEQRAAERHEQAVRFFIEVGEELDVIAGNPIELMPTCPTCGHIVCKHGELR